ncbi:PAS and ANTAR domain-containing protein [Rhodococcus cerastii]|nr:PAS and ANTAR domain-containing protein [Rhodococcus cerastii]
MATAGAPHRVGGFLYHREGDRWEWSDPVARMHGYEPGTVLPTTELILSHKHPDDRAHVAQTLCAIRTCGGSFSSRHRIVDTKGVTHAVVVVGDRLLDAAGKVIGSSGFYVDVTDTLGSTVKESVDEVVAEINSSRGSIEQAKGMLMLVYGITADRAFDVLTWRSQETNVKVRDVAEQLLARVASEFHVPSTLRTQFDHLILHN